MWSSNTGRRNLLRSMRTIDSRAWGNSGRTGACDLYRWTH
jgi:hypothetical protein